MEKPNPHPRERQIQEAVARAHHAVVRRQLHQEYEMAEDVPYSTAEDDE